MYQWAYDTYRVGWGQMSSWSIHYINLGGKQHDFFKLKQMNMLGSRIQNCMIFYKIKYETSKTFQGCNPPTLGWVPDGCSVRSTVMSFLYSTTPPTRQVRKKGIFTNSANEETPPRSWQSCARPPRTQVQDEFLWRRDVPAPSAHAWMMLLVWSGGGTWAMWWARRCAECWGDIMEAKTASRKC